jgi:hypothetical protein
MKMREMGNANKILSRKLQEKRPLGTPRLIWEDNTKMDLKK